MQKSDSKKRRIKDTSAQPSVGILQWFHQQDKETVLKTIEDLKRLNITHLRTGVSWADYHAKGGKEWYDWLMPLLGKDFQILPCFLYTPPSIGIANKTSSPPKGAKKFADFLDVIINKYGEYFEYVELWNEPNNRSEYDYTLDSNWEIFSEMITCASYWAHQLGKKTVLGGMSPIDPNWLDYMAQKGVLDEIDVVGIHGFPDVFENATTTWEEEVYRIQKVLDYHNADCKIWITEVGFSTWQHDEYKQVEEFRSVLKAPVERVYWYSMYDLHPSKETVDGFHLDEREYHFGLKTIHSRKKLLYRLLEENNLKNFDSLDWLKNISKKEKNKSVMITGGAGFVGTNLAKYFLDKGESVLIYDNLSRPGVERNLQFLLDNYDSVNVELADVRNPYIIEEMVERSKVIYHLAAQVAVTTSLVNPREDCEVNTLGTFNLLEAVRKSEHQPPIIFTSTNKVYGNLPDIELTEKEMCYAPSDKRTAKSGIDESRNLDFHSPYGVSKGAAEQYILDYSRTYGLKTVVFRMSCIYGPHQCGTEDQGWVAHFLISALKDNPITIYGDGKQVRDILFVEDLVKAFEIAYQRIDNLSGKAFNIGGGPSNAISLLELIRLIEVIEDIDVELSFEEERVGDQRYYVSDTSLFEDYTGWKATTSVSDGIENLKNWLKENYLIELKTRQLLNGINK
ncbi:MAG: NAD-dependent epimerase/dehydratase family protein [Candidatus Cyclobacteriaceae bacterium M2_1C_046]